jgi:hypothetical protein
MYEFLEAEDAGYTIPAAGQQRLAEQDRLPAEARPGDRRTRYGATSPASAMRRRAGKSPAVSWPRSNGTPPSFTRVSALS